METKGSSLGKVIAIIASILGVVGVGGLVLNVSISNNRVIYKPETKNIIQQVKIQEKVIENKYEDTSKPVIKKENTPIKQEEKKNEVYFTSETIGRTNAIVNRCLTSIESNFDIYNSTENNTFINRNRKISCLTIIIENIEEMKENYDIINSQVTNNTKYGEAIKYIQKYDEYKNELEKLKEQK